MSGRSQALRVEIVDDRLTISIGVEALACVVTQGEGWDWTETINDADRFAEGVRDALEDDEDETGLTPLQRAIDRAALVAVESGCHGVDRGEAA